MSGSTAWHDVGARPHPKSLLPGLPAELGNPTRLPPDQTDEHDCDADECREHDCEWPEIPVAPDPGEAER